MIRSRFLARAAVFATVLVPSNGRERGTHRARGVLPRRPGCARHRTRVDCRSRLSSLSSETANPADLLSRALRGVRSSNRARLELERSRFRLQRICDSLPGSAELPRAIRGTYGWQLAASRVLDTRRRAICIQRQHRRPHRSAARVSWRSAPLTRRTIVAYQGRLIPIFRPYVGITRG
jgi:hypothetical protein